MVVFLNYRMSDVSQNIDTLKAFFESIDKDVEIRDGVLYAAGKEETNVSGEPTETVFMNKAKEHCKKLRELLKGDFTLEGTIDTSFTAGEYMDFQFVVTGDSVAVRKSDWYCEEAMDSFEDYEDFCDGFFECSEEEYETLKDCEFVYLLETAAGDVLATEVPLYDVKDEF